MPRTKGNPIGDRVVHRLNVSTTGDDESGITAKNGVKLREWWTRILGMIGDHDPASGVDMTISITRDKATGQTGIDVAFSQSDPID